MKILALEFSSPQRSVAVLNGSESSISEVIETTPGNTMQPLGMVERALQQANLERGQIECIAIGIGPGSYTGIRVALALAQGWQLALGVKLVGVSSAECVAAQATMDGVKGRYSVVIDAQRGEFYLAGHEIVAGTHREISPLRLAILDEVRERERARDLLIGPEVTKWFPNGRQIFPRAETLARLAHRQKDFVSGEKLEPIYLRETQFVKAPPPRISAC